MGFIAVSLLYSSSFTFSLFYMYCIKVQIRLVACLYCLFVYNNINQVAYSSIAVLRNIFIGHGMFWKVDGRTPPNTVTRLKGLKL